MVFVGKIFDGINGMKKFSRRMLLTILSIITLAFMKKK